MIKIENTEVFGWEAAIRGMRNPMNSWDKSDSHRCERGVGCDYCGYDKWCRIMPQGFRVGENDLNLMQNLCKAGSDHSKFMRMINVTCDITAPLYWWKEFDTYKVGTVANSCSTMHKIHAKEFTLEDFSCEHMSYDAKDLLGKIIEALNIRRNDFLGTKQKTFWWDMIQLLPSSYNQKRTVQLNYQVLKAFDSREGHKLDEWPELLKWRNELPYFTKITASSNAN